MRSRNGVCVCGCILGRVEEIWLSFLVLSWQTDDIHLLIIFFALLFIVFTKYSPNINHIYLKFEVILSYKHKPMDMCFLNC